MSTPYVAEIRIFAGNFAPRGWALCNGDLMSISQNTALFSLLGTTYGGNGQTTFGLPNLQGAAPMNFGQGPGLTYRDLGESAGVTNVTLLSAEFPAHNHAFRAYDANDPSVSGGQGGVWENTAGRGGGQDPPKAYAASPIDTMMNQVALGITGGNSPHNNKQPYLGLTFIIALQGIFPPRS